MITRILKYINSLPVPITLRHYQMFGVATESLRDGELNSSVSWDVLRMTHPQFSISSDREEWLQACHAKSKKDGQDGGLIQRARDISAWLTEEHVESIFSVGVGGAGLEYHIKNELPGVRLVCSEFAEQNVAQLKKVFFEADDIIQFDILKGDWKSVREDFLPHNAVCLMYRVDASFSDREWRKIFRTLKESNVQKILFIPSPPLTVLSIVNRKWREIKWCMHKERVSFSGYVRTKKQFLSLWKNIYQSEERIFGGLKGFILTLC